MRFPTSEKSRTEPKKKKRRRKGISPGDKEIIPGTKEPRTLVMGEDQQKAVTDIANGKLRSQNRCKKRKTVRKPFVNEMRNKRTRGRAKSRIKENYRNAPIGDGSSESETEDDTDLDWIQEQDWSITTLPRFDETPRNGQEPNEENASIIEEGRYDLRPRKQVNYKE